jgi:subtilisin-like proprotein convertase family protein
MPIFVFLLLAALLGSGTARADDARCTISFSALRYDVCSGKADPASPAIASLANPAAFADSRLRLIKFGGPIAAEQRRAVEALGAEIVGYAPYYAYIVRMDRSRDAAARAIRGVIWVGPFLPAFKLDPNIARDLAGARIAERGGVERLEIGLHPGSGEPALRSQLFSLPGIDHQFSENAGDHTRLVVRFDRSLLAVSLPQIVSLEDVAYVGYRWPNELFNSQAGWLHQGGNPPPTPTRPIFARGIFGCGETVAALDTGLTVSHCSFNDSAHSPGVSVCNTGASCPVGTPNPAHRKVPMYYVWSGGSSPGDSQGHGTHVMGSLAGNDLGAGAVDCATFSTPGGNTDLDGTAPGAKIIAQEAGNSLQYLNNLGGTLYHAANTAFQNGARIHSNSWGSSCRNGFGVCISGCTVDYRATSRDGDQVVWDHPELAVFVAAGNSGGAPGDPGCGPGADVGAPGNAKNIFSIGSNLRGTAGNGMSGFSSRGPTQDRRTKPDLTAQGSSIISAMNNTACGTRTASGTSMATPTAAGLAALVREYLRRGFYPTGQDGTGIPMPNPSSALIKAILINGTHAMTGSGSGGPGPSDPPPNTSQGWGRIHLENALYFQGDSRKLWLVDETTGLQTGQDHTYTLNVVSNSEPFTVTLVWHDYPATVNANPTLINQLRLEVTAPDSSVWTQKLPPTGGLSNPNPFQATTTTDYDNRNNVHRIRFATPLIGTYAIRVVGINVAMGGPPPRQPYALVASGDIAISSNPDFFLSAVPNQANICAGDSPSFTINALGVLGWLDSVTLSASGLPAPSTGSFSTNPVTPNNPPATSTFTISNTGSVATGSYTVVVTGASAGPNHPATNKSTNIQLDVVAGTPAAGSLTSPANASTVGGLRPTLSWSAFPTATSYRVQIATDPGFASIVADQVVSATSFQPASNLAANTTYYWRVAGINACGEGAFTTPWSFTTPNMICRSPNLAIPDNNTTGVTDTLNVPSGGALSDLNVLLKVTHTYIGDLRFTLTKGSTSVQLLNRPNNGSGGCGGDNFDVIFDDQGSTQAQTTCGSGNPAYPSGAVLIPAQALAPFNGQNLAGTWTLAAVDLAAVDTGTVDEWCLIPTAALPPAIFADGFETP